MSGSANGTLFFQNLEKSKKEKKLSSKQIAEKCEFNVQSFTNWKSRGTIPSADVAIRIADYLGVSVRWLVLGEEDSVVKENLTADEMELLDLWRGIDDSHKPTALLMLKGLPLKISAVDSSVHTA